MTKKQTKKKQNKQKNKQRNKKYLSHFLSYLSHQKTDNSGEKIIECGRYVNE
jgi:RNA:NAD 2'-phosphotransferase (TPT1/KptA family)